MQCFIRLAAIVAMVLCSVLPGSLHAQVNVTTYHNDNARTGQNTQEIILTPFNVNSTQFGKLFTVAVDGYVNAQPLYVANLPIQGGTHNVLYIVTEHDSLYAIDADNGTVYWHINLIPAGGSTVSSATDTKCGDIVPEQGITGTPVIDINTGTLYLVALSKVNGTAVQFLHAIDIQSSAEKFGGPVNIQASAPGTAEDGNGTTVTFRPLNQNQRAALLLDNGHVVIAWSSHCDVDPWHGWVMSYAAATLAQEGVFNTSANGRANGVWMSGGGMAADANGNIFVVTGNGSWNGTTDFGDSIVKLGPPSGGAFPIVDYFTPYNQNMLSTNDTDVASGGLVLLPALGSGKQLLTQMGKEGKIYVLDQNNLGKNCATQIPACSGGDPQIVQEIRYATVGVWGSPAYWNGTVYWAGGSDDTGATDALKAFSFNANGSGLLSTTPTSKSAKAFGFSAPIPSISAGGATGGILWGLDDSAYRSTCTAGKNCQVLYAYDASNLANMLYNSSQAANSRDVPGSAVKFATPIIANGKVYVGSQYAVSAYGILSTFLPSPTFSPPAGNFNSSQTVTLSDAVATAAIYFTTDGTTPSASSAVYSGPLQIAQTTTIRAIVVANGYANSAVSTAAYTITPQSTNPAVDVDLSAVSNVYAIFANGSPVTNGGMDNYGYAYSQNLLGTSVVWSGTTFDLGGAGVPSAVDSTILALPAGNFSTIQFLGAAVQGNHVRQVFVVTYTDGTTDSFTQSMSDWTAPQHYPGESIASTMPYRVASPGTKLNGSMYLYGYSFPINGAKTVKTLTPPRNRDIVVLAVALSPAAGTPPMSPAPTFSPPAGSFNSSQTITLSDAVATAAIYFTTDGTTPSASSAVYSGPLQIAQTTTIRAIAVANGYANSAVSTAAYTITPQSTNPAVDVDLSAVSNVYAIFANGSPVTNGGMDNYGYAYSQNLLGTSVVWSGTTFDLGGAGVPSAVDSTILALPAGNFSTIQFLGAAVQGNHVRQVFVVTYTDGTTDSFTQSMSDWTAPQHYPGESIASTMPYRVASPGTKLNGSMYLYGYSFPINGAKTVKTLTPPRNRDIVLLSIALTP